MTEQQPKQEIDYNNSIMVDWTFLLPSLNIRHFWENSQAATKSVAQPGSSCEMEWSWFLADLGTM